ncbi:MAG: cob(I)yrinic acid a,c-diamide adenosyltransferase [Pseudomonadota bacterium]
MGHRLSKIYTRTGDAGDTGLGDGARVPKDDSRVEAYGTLDELNSAIGMIIAIQQLQPEVINLLEKIQNHLFEIGSEFCLPDYEVITPEHVKFLETHLDDLNANLSPLKEFLLPGGHLTAAQCHLARTICRRAERRIVAMAKDHPINTLSLKYINRLSDLLFVLARYINKVQGVAEPLWQHERKKS